MANQSHIYLLHDTAYNWNKWRFDNPTVIPDLTRAELSLHDLRWFDMTGANVREADLSGAFMDKSIFNGADLREANLAGADLEGAVMRVCNLREANLTGANLTNAILVGADLREAILTGAILTGADLTGAITE